MTTQTFLDFTISHEMSEADLRVWYALRNREGRESAIQNDLLAELVGMHPRTVQRVIHRLIHAHGKAIGSSMMEPAGYFVAVAPEEREEVAALHRGRALGMLKTAALIKGVTVEEEVRRVQTELLELEVA